MSTSSAFKTIRFRIIFSVLAFGWALFHALVLKWFGFGWAISIWDSVISNLLLMSTAFLMTTILQYYIPQKARYSYLMALCAVLTVIWFFLSRFIVFFFFTNEHDYASFFSLSTPLRIAFGFLIISCMALISVLWYTLQDQQQTEKRKTEADKLAKEAELFKLRQQLQPHFLFNSLNSINALIGAHPQQARTMIQQLSDFLRGTLKTDATQWISLNEELHQLNLYLEIEKVRFGHRLSTIIKNGTDGATLKLPALLLQPVLENAIKFGLYDTTGDIVISMEAKKENEQLVITVTNPFDPETSLPRKGTGFGLTSVQRRLYLFFARNDLLKTEIVEKTFITIIKIPQQP